MGAAGVLAVANAFARAQDASVIHCYDYCLQRMGRTYTAFDVGRSIQEKARTAAANAAAANRGSWAHARRWRARAQIALAEMAAFSAEQRLARQSAMATEIQRIWRASRARRLIKACLLRRVCVRRREEQE